MTSDADWWAHVSAAFVGTAIVVVIFAGALLIAQLVMSKRAKKKDEQTPVTRELLDALDKVDEGKLRVAVRRSVRPRTTSIPFDDDRDAPDSGLSGRALFEKRQAQADAAAIRRGEETQPVATIRRVMLCEPPKVDGETLFAYLRHHAPQPSGLAWDSENLGALATVTQSLYEGCQRDPLVADVFKPYDLDELRRHFVRTLMTLTKDGLDVETADALGRAHAHLKIRDKQFDAVTGHLVQALKGALQPRVFESVVHQLSPAVQALRTRIVR